MDNESKEYVFLWFIENYSYCHLKNGKNLDSPKFKTDDLGGTAWYLRVYPNGERDEDKGYISLYLKRRDIDDGPAEFPLTFELSFLATDESANLLNKWKFSFKRGVGYGLPKIIKTDDVLLRGKNEYLHRGTLRMRCKMWKTEDSPKLMKQITARTRFGMEEITFLHEIENFSALEPQQKKTFLIRSPSENGFDLESSLYFSDDSWCDGQMIVEIAPSDSNRTLIRCKFSLLDGSGKALECGDFDKRFDASKRDVKKIPLSLTRQDILSKKAKYLSNDKFSLMCEFAFSTGVEIEKIEKSMHDLPLTALKQITANNEDNEICSNSIKISTCKSAMDDYKTVYDNQLLTDVKLKTKTNTFPAHKFVLCARSSVFQAMLTNDMKEKNSSCIQVDDLEDNTVQDLLVFLYSDNLENLKWESATKLYYAADKYAIEKLKLLCSSFLTDNLRPSSACELLLLADTHNDCDLKRIVEDFIFQHEEQVFGSDEWRNLIETNSLLVSKTMCLKYMKNV